LDGELTEAEMAEVDALIERDDVAAEVLNDLDLVRSAFGALGEVRAPRSFAIPADAATSPARVAASSYTTSGPVALFRRTEMFMRASAAVAALFFVVAVVNNPSGGTPVGTFEAEAQTSMLAAESTGSGPALEPMQATGEAA